MESNAADQLCDLLREWEDQNLITKPEIKMQAQFCPDETCETSIVFKVKTGLTIAKYRKLKRLMEKKFPWLTVKKIYNKHIIILYYSYERS